MELLTPDLSASDSVTATATATALEKDTHHQSTDQFIDTPADPMPRWKRIYDIVFALAGLIVLAPLFLLTSVFIKAVSRGPVFFRQHRYGLHGNQFTILKFRTMTTDADSQRHQEYVRGLAKTDGVLTKRDITSRIIPGGQILRAMGIDELPQLFNVLLGSMSLVGPRPDLLAVVDYEEWQRPRFNVVPGITGLWQVSGKNSTSFDEMVQLDIDYIKYRSPLLDLKILFLTIPAIFQQAFGRQPNTAAGTESNS